MELCNFLQYDNRYEVYVVINKGAIDIVKMTTIIIWQDGR